MMSFDGLLQLVGDVLMVDAESLSLDSSPETVPTWDSINHLTLVMAVEEQAGVQFTPEELSRTASMRALWSALSAKGATC